MRPHFFERKMNRLRYWRLMWIPRDTYRCNAFGGSWIDNDGVLQSRTCDKDRWHTDSHTYEILEQI